MSGKASTTLKKAAPAKEAAPASPILLVSLLSCSLVHMFQLSRMFDYMHVLPMIVALTYIMLTFYTAVEFGDWLVCIEYVLQHLQQESYQHDSCTLVCCGSSIGCRYRLECRHVGYRCS